MCCQKVMKTPTAKNFAIVMTVSKQFLVDYLLKSPSNGKDHHMAGSSLEVIMDKFRTLVSPNYCNFMSSLKHFVRSRMGAMDSIMVFKDHSSFKYVHGSKLLGQSKDKMFVFRMLVDPPKSGVDLVKRM